MGVKSISGAIVALSVLALGVWYLSIAAPHVPPPVVRVGVDHSPPFYLIAPDGSVSGLAVDILSEAARRKKMRLQWVPVRDVSLDDLLDQNRIDLWPLAHASPERLKKYHLTESWLENNYVLISLREHPLRTAEDAAGEVIVAARFKIPQVLAETVLRKSKLAGTPLREDAIAAVCRGEAGGALMDGRYLAALLLSRPPGCENAHFNLAVLSGATIPLRIVARPEMKGAADDLRDGIAELAAEGYVDKKFTISAPLWAESARSVGAQQLADAHRLIYQRIVVAFILGALGLTWLLWRGYRLKRYAEESQDNLRESQGSFDAFMRHSPAMASVKDGDGRYIYVNDTFCRTLSRTPEECLGQDVSAIFPPDVVCEMSAAGLEVLRHKRSCQVTIKIAVAGEIRDYLFVKFPFVNKQGETLIGCNAFDVSDRETALRNLTTSEVSYGELFENTPLPAWVVDARTLEFLDVNVAAVRRYGWSHEEFLGSMTLPDVLAASELDADRSNLGTGDSSQTASGACWHRTRDGSRLNVEVTSFEMEFALRPVCLMIVRDLTQQEQTLAAFRISDERWQLSMHGSGDALWDWDIRSGRVFRAPRWFAMLGYLPFEIGDSREDFLSLLHPDDIERVQQELHDYLAHEIDAFSVEYRLRRKDGVYIWILDRGRAIWDERDKPLRMAGSQTDVTERKEAEERLEQEAHTDALTSLPNRREFDRLLALEFHLARGSNQPLCVCVCDLDLFKQVNDTWGHAAGDRVLITFAETLRGNRRSTDFLGRIGGDEFILAMPCTTASQATEIVNRIRHRFAEHEFIQEMHEPGRDSFRVTSSFGVAELHAQHDTASDLIAEADRRLYAAKQSGRNQTQLPA